AVVAPPGAGPAGAGPTGAAPAGAGPVGAVPGRVRPAGAVPAVAGPPLAVPEAAVPARAVPRSLRPALAVPGVAEDVLLTDERRPVGDDVVAHACRFEGSHAVARPEGLGDLRQVAPVQRPRAADDPVAVVEAGGDVDRPRGVRD